MSDKKNVNVLLQHCAPVFQQAHLFQQLPVEDVPENFRQQVNQVLSEFEQQCINDQLSSKNIEEAKYALAAYVDELVLSSNWSGRSQWRNKTLQLALFGEHLAGENFFKRLSQLRQDPITNIDVLEVFYICLQLGFEGMYRQCAVEQLQALKAALQNQIETLRGHAVVTLSPLGMPPGNLFSKTNRDFPLWIIIVGALVIIFLVYVGYLLAINHVAKKILKQINKKENTVMVMLSHNKKQECSDVKNC